ncbi:MULTISPECIES: hypothetical protein [unclassified Modestobacter]
MVRAPRSPTGRALATVGVLAFCSWVTFVAIEIATVPEPGAASVDALATQVASSLAQRDADTFQALVVDDAPADYAEQLFASLPSAGSGLEAVVESSGRADVIVVADPAGRGTCLAWQVVPDDERYLLGVVPPLTGCSQR